MNPKNRNGPPKVVDSAPQESLLPAGRPGLSEFPLEDRSDPLGDPPSTLFPAGEVAGPTAPVGGPGPSGTTPRGRDDALDTRLLPKPSIVGRGPPTPDGSMTHRLLDQRRKQPRRAPGADPNPLGPDPHDHRQHPEPPRWTPQVVVAGRASGKARLPPPGTPPEPPQGRRPGRLPQRGVTRCRMNPWNVEGSGTDSRPQAALRSAELAHRSSSPR
jgi:hypothetical protein